MDKLLTISVAAYNVEEFIENTLECLKKSKNLDLLEIFIIDDGGTDKTFQIAKKFEESNPTVFHAVHKENGGYGSTINYSVKHATGKYFKQLDGDDWFITEQLDRFVEELTTCDDDVVITPYYAGKSLQNCELVPIRQANSLVYRLEEFNTTFTYGVWNITYKLDILRNSGMILPEHTLYSDQIYSVIPFSKCKTIRFFEIPVYFYRMGREGQSTSIASRRKHSKEMLNICEMLYDFYEENECCPYILSRVARYYVVALKTILIYSSEINGKQMYVDYEKRMKIEHPTIYLEAEKSNNFGQFVRLMRKTNYCLFPLLKILPGGGY